MRRRTIGGVVVWQRPVSVESDTDLTTLLRLELLAVGLDSVRVRNDDGVSDTVRSRPECAHEQNRHVGGRHETEKGNR